MYDAMSVLIDAFGKMLRKKPDLLSRPLSSSSSSSSSNVNNGYLNSRPNIINSSKEVQHYCGTWPDFKDPVVPLEAGEKIAKHIRKVRKDIHWLLGFGLETSFGVRNPFFGVAANGTPKFHVLFPFFTQRLAFCYPETMRMNVVAGKVIQGERQRESTKKGKEDGGKSRKRK